MENVKTFKVLGNTNAAEGIASLTPAKRKTVKLIDAYRSYPASVWADMIAACFNDRDQSDATAGLRRWRQATKKHIVAGASIPSVVTYMLEQDSPTLTQLSKRYCPALYEDAHKMIGKPLSAETLSAIYAASYAAQPITQPAAAPNLVKK